LRRKVVRRRALAWHLKGLTSTGSGPRSWRGCHHGRRPRSWQGSQRGRWGPADLSCRDDLRGIMVVEDFPAQGGARELG
jgi:hypothetical protein